MKSLFFLIFILTYSLPAKSAGSCSADGGDCSGGGSTTNSGAFYDAELEKGKFVPSLSKKTRDVYNGRVQKVFSIVKELIPQFGAEIRTQEKKPWHFMDDVAKVPEENTGIKIPYSSAAVHDGKKVLVDKSWYFKNPNVKEEDRTSMFVHEIVQGYRLDSQNHVLQQIDPENTTTLTNMFMRGDFTTGDTASNQVKLRDALFTLMKRSYFLPQEEKFVTEFSESVALLCKNTKPFELGNGEFQVKIRKIFRSSMDDFLGSLDKNESSTLDSGQKRVLAVNFANAKLVPVLGDDPRASDETFTLKRAKNLCKKVGVNVLESDKAVSTSTSKKDYVKRRCPGGSCVTHESEGATSAE